MKPLTDAVLGYNQMRAAIAGGHDLVEAWRELGEMVDHCKTRDAVAGGIFCLMGCVDVMDAAGLLPTLGNAEFDLFLGSGSQHRAVEVMALLEASDKVRLGRLTVMMIDCVVMHRGMFAGGGVLPVVRTG